MHEFIKPIPPNLAGRANNSLTVSEGAQRHEVGYQFGMDDIFMWLHQVSDV